VFLDEKEVMALEATERAKMVAQQDGHNFALGPICPLRFLMRLYPLSMGVIWRFLVSSASKFLQNLSNVQNISVTFSMVIIAISVL